MDKAAYEKFNGTNKRRNFLKDQWASLLQGLSSRYSVPLYDDDIVSPA